MRDPDKFGPTPRDTEILIRAVHKELISLRGAFGALSMQKFGQYPTLREVWGGNDLIDDYSIFLREMELIVSQANRDEAAAALSITAPADQMLHRLEHVVDYFENNSGEARDQRTGRRWSDRGMPKVAAELVTISQLEGWTGREVLGFELSGTRETFHLTVGCFLTEKIDVVPPEISLWKTSGDEVVDDSTEFEYDLRDYRISSLGNDRNRFDLYRIAITPSEIFTHLELSDPRSGLAIWVSKVGDPIRTLTFSDKTDRMSGLKVEFSVYREVAMIGVSLTP